MLLNRGPSWRQWGRSQPIEKAEDFPEQLPRHRHLGHLEGDIATVPDDLGADFHPLQRRTAVSGQTRSWWTSPGGVGCPR